MDNIKGLIQNRLIKKSKTKTNKYWLIAEEIAKITRSTTARWLRSVKTQEYAVNRALVELKEVITSGKIKNPIGYFVFLLKKYSKIQCELDKR
jgi:hypothetical protein